MLIKCIETFGGLVAKIDQSVAEKPKTLKKIPKQFKGISEGKKNLTAKDGKEILNRGMSHDIDMDFKSADAKEQLRQLLFTVKAVRRGDFAVRMPIDQEGIIAEIGEVLNDIIDL